MKFESVVVFMLTVIIVLLTIQVTLSFRAARADESTYSLLSEISYDEGTGPGQASP